MKIRTRLSVRQFRRLLLQCLYMILLLMCVPVEQAHAQKRTTVTVKTPSPGKTKEVFEVIDGEIKDGSYRRYLNKVLIEAGYYKSGRKDSLWTYYTVRKEPVATGNYSNDQRVGYWTFYSRSGRMVQRYDYDADSLIYFDVEEERKSGPAPAVFPDTSSERMALFIGGYYYMYAILNNYMKYPEEAWLNKQSAKLLINFIVDTTGHVTDVKSLNPAGHGFDEEGVRLIRLLDRMWIPAWQGGRKVKMNYRLPLTFRLE